MVEGVIMIAPSKQRKQRYYELEEGEIFEEEENRNDDVMWLIKKEMNENKYTGKYHTIKLLNTFYKNGVSIFHAGHQ